MQNTIMIRFLIRIIEKLERVAPRGRNALKSAAGLKNRTDDQIQWNHTTIFLSFEINVAISVKKLSFEPKILSHVTLHKMFFRWGRISAEFRVWTEKENFGRQKLFGPNFGRNRNSAFFGFAEICTQAATACPPAYYQKAINSASALAIATGGGSGGAQSCLVRRSYLSIEPLPNSRF